MKGFLSVQETAKLLGISKVAVIKQIRAGKIKAGKIGNIYVIDSNELTFVKDQDLSEEQKRNIEQAVEKTIDDYAETLRLLKDT